MVSVAARLPNKNSGYPLRVEQWTADMKFKADALIREVLKGVGVESEEVKHFESITWTVRRLARDEERAMVVEKYLECSV